MVSSPPLIQIQPTALLGRTHELETIRNRIVAREVRLLTLTGPAGVGKTRLALEAGRELADAFPDGAIMVDLTPVRDPSRVLFAIAQTIGITDNDNLPVADRLEEYLRDRRMLLILDNFERVLAAASPLAELLPVCPQVTLLATSRIPLHLRWEQTQLILPLAVPDLHFLPEPSELSRIASVALFLERAQAINSDFALTDDNARAVAELVVRLDGLPLAIELAAARTPLLSPQMILERWDQRLSLLRWEAQDLPERQQSLDAAIGWSYDLLTKDEQTLFQLLAVFVHGFVLESAEAIVGCAAEQEIDVMEGLGSLVDKSLIQVQGQGAEHVRYSMLESIREYAWERLAADADPDTAAGAHARYFLELAEHADPQLRTRGQLAWFQRLEQEHDNLRVACRWLLDHASPEPSWVSPHGPGSPSHGDHEAALRLAAALGYFWWTRGYGAEGRRWLEEALARAPDADAGIRAKALLWAGASLIYEGDMDRSRARLEEALTLGQERQDRSTIALGLIFLGARAVLAGNHCEGGELLQDALSRWEEPADPFPIGVALFYLGTASFIREDYEQAVTHYSDAASRFTDIGDARLSGAMHLYRAFAHLKLRDPAGAVEAAQEGVRVGVTFQDRWHLTLGVETALRLMDGQTEPEKRARLLGARDALRQATRSMQGYWQRMSDQRAGGVQEQLEEERTAAYQEGRSLSLHAIGTLTMAMLDDVARRLADSRTTREQQLQESPLSDREHEVLQLVADGLSSKAIGKQLSISVSTVNYHLTSVFNKLGVDTRAQAVATAAQRSLL